MSVVIETTLGDLTVDLFVEQRPLTCLNFLKLCKIKYYNLNLFHSVNSNFCVQTGDPTGKGDGGESIHGLLQGPNYRFYQGEVQPKIKHDRTGLLSMVSHGQGMLGSQFVITLSPDLDSLDGEHCVFGEIVEGNDVLLKLNEAITDEHHRPYQDIRITHMVILDDPFPDPEGLGKPPSSPIPPSTKDLAYSRIPADEPLKDTATQEELDELVQAREAAARATILEMVGDLPDAEIAPPENVLFVCKLNPVTSDHDLSIIFSRFGKVKSCEVIRDSVTGDSLQYAFVEFDNQKSCEEAYFKMDNVLIDDRRIHVDFSQSVAKWHGKGRGVEMFGPPPPGGWGNKTRRNERNDRNDRNNRNRDQSPGRGIKRESGYNDRRMVHHRPIKTENNYRDKNGSRRLPKKNSYSVKKEVDRKKRRRNRSTSSSSSSESSSSSDSSDSEPRRRKIRRSAKQVTVVVNALKLKKKRKNRKRYDSDSDDKKRRKRRNKSVSEDSSSEDDKRRKKKRAVSSEPETKPKKKKRKQSESSDESSDHKNYKKKSKKRRQEDSDQEKRYKKKKAKNGSSKKRRHSTSDSDSSSSSN